MPRLPRFDRPGRRHHVFNRGIARRTVFERREDVRYFLSLLAREARKGAVFVHAYCILTTHFHLIVSTPDGDLSGVMQRVMNRYVRYFNRTRKRDGPLFRGRFGSRPITSDRYLRILIRYIDQNAVDARLVRSAALYPYGSALLYSSPRRPQWLDTSWVDGRIRSPSPARNAEAYARALGASVTDAELGLVAARVRAPANMPDELDDLVAAAPVDVRAWMERKARVADQTKPGLPYAGADAIQACVARARASDPEWRCVAGTRQSCAGWPILEAGLLRDIGGLTCEQIRARLRLGQGTVQHRLRQHRFLLQGPSEYSRRAGEVGRASLRMTMSR